MSVFNLLVSMVLVVLALSSWAGTVVCSDLSEDVADVLCDAEGWPLPLGCYVAVGHFGSRTPSEIEQKIGDEGIPGLMSIWEGFGDSFTIGRGSGQAGCFEVELREVLGPRLSGVLHVVVMNGPSSETSTSLTLLSFEGKVAPGEMAGGLSETHFLHLREASVVIGADDEGGDAGIRALPVTSTGFATWVHDQLGSGEPTLLALGADSNGYGPCNLAEYVLLGDPEVAVDEISPDFVVSVDTGELEGRFAVRSDDPLVTYEVEVCSNLVEELWEKFDGEIEVNEEASLAEGMMNVGYPCLMSLGISSGCVWALISGSDLGLWWGGERKFFKHFGVLELPF